MDKADKREWRTSSFIEAYWAVEPDESLRLPGTQLEQAVKAKRRAYQFGAWPGAGDSPFQHPGAWWDQQ